MPEDRNTYSTKYIEKSTKGCYNSIRCSLCNEVFDRWFIVIGAMQFEKGAESMKSRKVRRNIIIVLFAGFICCACLLGFIRWEIQSGLGRQCAIAQAAHPHPEDAVAALLEYVQSDSHTLKERNLAVWSLGQARDSRALPILEKYFNGEQCDHDSKLCQSELEKAIMLCKSDAPNLLCIKTP